MGNTGSCGRWCRYDERTYNTLLQGCNWNSDMSCHKEKRKQSPNTFPPLFPIIPHDSPLFPTIVPKISPCCVNLLQCSEIYLPNPNELSLPKVAKVVATA